MTRRPKPKTVEPEGEYYPVCFRDPGGCSVVRTPSPGDGGRGGRRRGGDGPHRRANGKRRPGGPVGVDPGIGPAGARGFAEEILERIETRTVARA